jgi:hypothetical protein
VIDMYPQERPHIILCGPKADRDKVVARLRSAAQIILSEADPPSDAIPVQVFNNLADDKRAAPTLAAISTLTFSSIMGESALYTFAYAPDADAGQPELNDSLVQGKVNEIVTADGTLKISACLDKLISGPSEEPGISPGGMPTWLPGDPYQTPPLPVWWRQGLQIKIEPSSASARPIAAKTAIFILDTAPVIENDQSDPPSETQLIDAGWRGKDIDLYADLTGLILRDPSRVSAHNQAAQRDVTSRTAALRQDRLKTIPYHGLIIAAMCRDLAPPETPIILLRVQQNDGKGTVHALSCAFEYARQVCEKLGFERMIINLSLGIRESTRSEVDSYHLLAAMTRLLELQPNTFFVCSAGNTGRQPTAIRFNEDTAVITAKYERLPAEEPAAYADLKRTLTDEAMIRQIERRVIGHAGVTVFNADTFATNVFNIGASDRFDYSDLSELDYAPFSNKADLVVPGTNLVMRCHKEDKEQYLIWSGTSFAAPQISGMIARLLAEGTRPAEISQRLQLGAQALPLSQSKVTTSSANPDYDTAGAPSAHLNPKAVLQAGARERTAAS